MSEIVVITASQSAALNPCDSGFAHGYGLFETLKLSGGRLYLFEAHWQRMMHSAAALGLACEHTEADVVAAIRELVEQDGLVNAVVKLSLLREAGGTRLFVYARPSQSWPATASLQLNSANRINHRSLLVGHKTHNYMEQMLLMQRAREGGFTDALRLNLDGALAETASANFFFIQSGVLCTPSVGCGILPGTRRDAVLSVANELKLEVCESEFLPSVFSEMECAFITNASTGVLPVHLIVGDGAEYTLETRHARLTELAHALTDYECEYSKKL